MEGAVMNPIRGALAALMLLFVGPAWAAEPGTASGRYDHDGTHIAVSHAVALFQDNAEGLLDHGQQVRVLLADREIPVEDLYGIAFPPVRAMAAKGKVRGLLLEFNPADRTNLRITVLDRPSDPNAFLPSLSLSDSSGLWRSLTSTPGRISGDFHATDGSDLTFSFSAPVISDPVVADMKGAQAQSSEQVRVLIARAKALGSGDLAAALALTSREAGSDLASMPPAELKQASAEVGGMIAAFKAIRRVVVRQHSAVALMAGGSWSSLVFEDGGWKVVE
jgi:hypothetical protein